LQIIMLEFKLRIVRLNRTFSEFQRHFASVSFDFYEVILFTHFQFTKLVSVQL
jgi:hypothetical protein